MDLASFAKELRIHTKPILIVANKADLCQDLTIINKIPNDTTIACSAESELLLRKATKSGIIDYVPGDEIFSINQTANISEQQKKALDLVKNVLLKIKTTGIQQAINTAVFDILQLIVVYPVEDENKLCNKNGDILPDSKLVTKDSTAKELAALIHADLAKGFLHAIDCKTKQRIGADHKLQNGDVIKIVSTLSRG